MRVRALLKRVTLLRSRSALSATLPPISGRGRFFGQKNTLRGRPSGRRPPARQKAAHIWRDRDRLHTCRGNRARAPGRKPPQPSRVEARTQIRHAASPGEGARGWGSERASHHMGLGAAASASGAVEPKGGLVSCWGAHRGSCQPWWPALAEHRARAQHAGRSAAAVGGEASGGHRRAAGCGLDDGARGGAVGGGREGEVGVDVFEGLDAVAPPAAWRGVAHLHAARGRLARHRATLLVAKLSRITPVSAAMRSLPLGTAALDSLCHLDLAGECTGQTAFLLDHHHPGPG
jgi:hypothetical protein